MAKLNYQKANIQAKCKFVFDTDYYLTKEERKKKEKNYFKKIKKMRDKYGI